MSDAISRIGYLQIDAAMITGWFAQALTTLGDDPLNAWCDDERQTGKAGLLIADDLAAADVRDFAARWPRGRLFTPVADLRWEQLASGALHAVLIADVNEHQRLGMQGVLPLRPEGPARSLMLWGEYRDKAWREERIPGLTSYLPASWSGSRAALKVQEYRASWPDPRQPFAAERLVVRYLAYDGNFEPTNDPRFQRGAAVGAAQ